MRSLGSSAGAPALRLPATGSVLGNVAARLRRSGASLRGLRARTTVIILIAFALSHLAGVLLYSRDRHDALEVAETLDVAERAANLSILLRNLPAAWREDVVRARDSRTFRAWISPEPTLRQTAASAEETGLLTYLRSLLPELADREVRVQVAPAVPDHVIPPERQVGPATASEPPLTKAIVPSVVLISVHHPEGEWLNFIGYVTAPPSILPSLLRTNLLLSIFVVAVVAFWLVHRVTAPLSRLSTAAERLGKNIRTEPLSEDGPAEVAQAARAFNRMQARLSRLVENRTELLAAISHDLRTPITQMRLRAELMPAGTQRRKTLESLDEMEATVLTFLDFARAQQDREDRLKIDLGALVESICLDRSDVGADIAYEGEDHLLIECKRLALKRALSNLIDNALKYGDSVRVGTSRVRGGIRIRIEDDGPGIPPGELERVFAPFYRGDRSRSRQTGGVGLGLSIAQAIVQDHGGDIALENRPGGGLRVDVVLPA